jgi:hypothetical protein
MALAHLSLILCLSHISRPRAMNSGHKITLMIPRLKPMTRGMPILLPTPPPPLPMASSSSRKLTKSSRSLRPSVRVVRMVMMTALPQMQLASEARSASRMMYLRHRHHIIPNQLHLNACDQRTMEGQSGVTRSRLKKMRKKRRRRKPLYLPQNQPHLKRMGKRVGRKNPRRKRKSGGISLSATDKVC